MKPTEIEKNLRVIESRAQIAAGWNSWHCHHSVVMVADGGIVKVGFIQVQSLNGAIMTSTHYAAPDGNARAVRGRDLGWLAQQYHEDNGGRAARLAAIAAKGQFEIAHTFGLPETSRAGHRVLFGGSRLEITEVDEKIVAFTIRENGRVIPDALSRRNFVQLVEMNLLAVAA